jgi:ABC-type dipeptide/oligopeptide/nickel transport system permease subunit
MTTLEQTAEEGALFTDEASLAGKSARQLFWERFREDKTAIFAGCVVIMLILLAIFGGPLAADITGHPDQAYYVAGPHAMEDAYGVPKGPNSQFWFGADGQAHDLLVRTMYGARTSLIVGVAATAIAVMIGLAVGLAAGFYRGWLDSALSRGGDVMLALPSLLISIGIVAACAVGKNGCVIGPISIQPGIEVVIVVIALFTWPYMARIVRGLTLSIREREFVDASRSLGATNRRIIIREVMPNLIGPIIVFTTLLIPNNILYEAALSYLGLGVSPGTASWGSLLNQANQFYNVAWWLILFPGLFLVITTLAFNLLGDGLRDALDVRTDR